MAIDIEDSVRARLTAYIAPNVPRTKAQIDAFEDAVTAQIDYEEMLSASHSAPYGAQSYSVSNDGTSVSVTYASGVSAGYSDATLHPYTWALLKNAGLLKRGAIPTARRV